MKENVAESVDFGEEVRKQGKRNSVKDLVFDPVSGEFLQIEKNQTPISGEVVTQMTQEGFA